MKLMFIGTGSGITSLKRNHSSILLQHNSHNLLIDCGDGTAKALKQRSISFNSIDSILFSHYHADHFAGIAALVTQMKLSKREKRLAIFTHRNLVEPLENFLKYSYLFKETFEFTFDIIPFTFENELTITDGLYLQAKQNSHITNKHEINSYDAAKFVSSSFYLRTENNHIVYTADIGGKNDLFLFDEVSPQIFITETSHINLSWLLEIFTKIQPAKVILTHISDEDEFKIFKWLENIPAEIKPKFSMAEDGQIVTLNN